MVDATRLLALLQVDERGEYLVEKLSSVLVDRRKRRELLIKLHEIEDERHVHTEAETVLTRSEAEVLRIILDARKPCTAAEVQNRAAGGSLRKYRQHASATLNGLTAKGLLGKVRGGGRETYFAPAREAVKLALVQLGQTPNDCDLEKIREITELPYAVILETVENMKDVGETA